MADSYVCSGATMKCTMGTSTARLTVLPIRTVFLTGQPMANISDHLTMVNLAPFGRCRSLGFPATAAATAAHHGHLTPMPCMHNTPFPWMNGKNDYIVKGDPALLKSSTCQCMWGGTISLITDGQTPTGPAENTRKPKVNYSQSQSDIVKDDYSIDADSVLNGIQMALDAAGFLPGVGAVPDLVNASISALRGNWLDAGMSVLAAVPLIGDAAAAGKIAYRGMKMAKVGRTTIAKQAKKYISKSITKDELLAKGICKSEKEVKAFEKALRSERKQFAEQFYARHGMDQKAIKSHVNGIDLNQPVKVKKMPPPEKIHRFEDPAEIGKLKSENRKGSYFFPPKKAGAPPTTPRRLGIQPVVKRNGKLVRKKKVTLTVDTNAPDIEYLESTASALPAPLDNNWGSSRRNVSNWKATKGGATQMFIPNSFKEYLHWQ